jgi:hypothetical protein
MELETVLEDEILRCEQTLEEIRAMATKAPLEEPAAGEDCLEGG